MKHVSDEEIYKGFAMYYDVLYQDKPYEEEALYINKLIQKYVPNCKNILELGCGTGKHAIKLYDYGYEQIDCIDLSIEMLRKAEENKKHIQNTAGNNNINFYQGDICNFVGEITYDAVISLFSVMAYLTENETLDKAISNASRNLKAGGLFIFDTWYGNNVLQFKPDTRVKKIENEDLLIYRIATPSFNYYKNIVEIEYKLIIKDKKTNICEEVVEKHKLRYMFVPEMEKYLNNNGFELIRVEKLLTGEDIDEDSSSYYICFIARKIK